MGDEKIKSQRGITVVLNKNPIEPIEIADLFNVNPSKLEYKKTQNGIYLVNISGKQFYTKASDDLRYCFSLSDEDSAKRYLGMYQDLAENGVYPNDSKFALRKTSEEGIGLIVLMPVLDVNKVKYRNRKRKKKYDLASEILSVYNESPGPDFEFGENWGKLKRNVHFHDLHLTKSIDRTLGEYHWGFY